MNDQNLKSELAAVWKLVEADRKALQEHATSKSGRRQRGVKFLIKSIDGFHKLR